jgi:hypothetical protein
VSSLTAHQFQTLCDDIYADREQIYEFNPAASQAEALLWMVLGSLFSLLSLNDEEIPVVTPPTVPNYVDAICVVVEAHREGEFDPRGVLLELIARPDFGNEPAKSADD